MLLTRSTILPQLLDFVSSIHSSMKIHNGVEHRGLVFLKGANLGLGSRIQGVLYDLVKDTWIRMNLSLH